MQWRELITILTLSTVVFSSIGYALAHDHDQATPRLVAEPAPTREDEARFEQLAALLNQSATGRELLELKEAYRINVRFETGRGSSFNQAANRILLESGLDPLSAALIFAHEMNHARAFHEGEKAHRKTDSRQAYISKMLWEEAEGMAVSIQVKMELEENGVAVADLTLPFEGEYLRTYRVAAARARLAEPSTGAQQLDAIGMAAGVEALFAAHLRGETRTANTHETCLEYYGRHWDEAHPIKAFVANLLT
jgi:hypothetical protein